MLSNDRRRKRHQTVSFSRRLTLLDARRDGDEGHEAAEAQVDPQQRLVEVAGDGVRVVLVHEGEGHGGDGVEEEGGAHHGQVPALVLGGSSQPAGGDTHAVARDSAESTLAVLTAWLPASSVPATLSSPFYLCM